MSKLDVKEKQAQKRNRALRIIMLLVILIATTALGLMHQYIKQNPPVGVDALCPFGGLEALFTLIFSGTLLKKIAVSSFILLIAVLVSALLFRRSFCGNICPLGTLQELFGKLGKKLFKKRFELPAWLDKPARFLKYLALVVIVVLSFIAADLIIRPYDPWATYHHLFSAELFTEFLVGFIILMITLAGSLFYDRFFCKYLCPMGGFLGVLGKIGLFKIRRDQSTCIDCKACTKACPVNIQVHTLEQVTDAECLNCNECVNVCPVKDTLYIAGPGAISAAVVPAALPTAKPRGLSPLFFLLATVGIFILVVGVTTLTNNFTWVQKTLVEEVKTIGNFDPELIKGRMTLAEVAAASGITRELFIARFGLTEAEFQLPIKDSIEKRGASTEDVRAFVREELAKKK
jgi:polyferredoxin